MADIERFTSQKQVVAYAGLSPGQRESAGKCQELHLEKTGSKMLRWAMVEAAWRLVRHTTKWKRVYEQLKQRLRAKKAIVAVARRLLTVVKRTSGPPKGERCVAKLPGGSRTVKPLAQVYEEEGVPPRMPLTAGEERAVQESGTAEFVESLAREHVVPRRGSRRLK